MTAPVLGWARIISDVTPAACFLVDRRDGSFHTACGMRWSEKTVGDDPDSAGRWQLWMWDGERIDMPAPNTRLCKPCARAALKSRTDLPESIVARLTKEGL